MHQLESLKEYFEDFQSFKDWILKNTGVTLHQTTLKRLWIGGREPTAWHRAFFGICVLLLKKQKRPKVNPSQNQPDSE